ncbi:alpha-N-arabinofuranosidase [Reichenbachiella agariperforans]|uniref:alpha-N-arabinofuranosidase n=1 Tax=Reichenbachiella agariperforans TaxID=156994 RepID=UPI001C0A11A4|nr:alpha-L-arabinofuranosidase C-terminal domain-containing protein [Reichenbachiella agariperforans]MBU2913504.1 alpha-N-arabinofuranosidase [Reichenbachiella agariperforans]
MIRRIGLIIAGCGLSLAVLAQKEVSIKIDTESKGPVISKHIYGHFAEHLGRCIYDGFYVGDNETKIPNTDGVRNDIVAALKELQIPNLRWPGGCFADTYHWKDGIGPKEERPTIVNRWWGDVTEDNSFGTHEFLNMCELLGTAPYLSGNVGSGTVQEFADWMQYVNNDGVSPMSDLRRENGREDAWNVKYWGVGNEAWGCGGNMTADYYANVYRQYATYMGGWTSNEGIQKIASGASSGDYDWTETLMKKIPARLIDGIALHHYSVIDWDNKGSASEFSEEQYFITMQRAYEMEELVTKHIEVMDKYDPEGKIDLVVDEWGGWYDVEEGTNPGFLFQQNTMRDAMIAGMTLNIFNNHANRVKMANLAQAVNVLQAVILTDEEKMILTPTYHVMRMYTVHHDATLMPLEINNTSYVKGDAELPAISASASEDLDGKKHLSIVNIDASQSYKIRVPFSGVKKSQVSGEVLASGKIQDHNTFEIPSHVAPVEFKDFKVKEGNVELTLPPASVVVLEIQ